MRGPVRCSTSPTNREGRLATGEGENHPFGPPPPSRPSAPSTQLFACVRERGQDKERKGERERERAGLALVATFLAFSNAKTLAPTARVATARRARERKRDKQRRPCGFRMRAIYTDGVRATDSRENHNLRNGPLSRVCAGIYLFSKTPDGIPGFPELFLTPSSCRVPIPAKVVTDRPTLPRGIDTVRFLCFFPTFLRETLARLQFALADANTVCRKLTSLFRDSTVLVITTGK